MAPSAERDAKAGGGPGFSGEGEVDEVGRGVVGVASGVLVECQR
jgi:hypothetical protein